MLADLSFTTFWDAFHDHPKNAPEDMDAYMSEAFTTARLSEELVDPNAVFLIAEIDEKPAGYAKLLFENIEEPVVAERPVELCRLYSTTEFIGRGVGQRLMDECFRIALERAADVMWLGVWEFNPRAQRFYEKQGFRVVGDHVFLLGSDPQTDHLMQVEIG
jgi:ribosomal protein S18 acetylase RimI-like enzyme